MSRSARIGAATEPPDDRASAIGRALLRCRTIAEAHVVGAWLALESSGVRPTLDMIAWRISLAGDGTICHRSFVVRGLADAVRSGTLTRVAVGVYAPGPRIADLVGYHPNNGDRNEEAEEDALRS